jgi:hypothetical protein
MDVQASISHLPAPYQWPVPSLRESTPYVPTIFPEDIVDCVEIRTELCSPATTAVTSYISFTKPITEKGSLIDLFV